MRQAKTIEEAEALFGESAEPVTCTKEGTDSVTATSLDEAAKYFAGE